MSTSFLRSLAAFFLFIGKPCTAPAAARKSAARADAPGYDTIRPGCGKEGRYLRESAPLKKLVFLQRADTDSIRKMKSAEAFPRLYEAVHPPKEPAVLAHLPALLSSLLGSAECYEAALTKNESAAACVYQTLFEMEDRS